MTRKGRGTISEGLAAVTKWLPILVMALGGPAAAGAAWLYGTALGTNADGPVAVLTTVADIGQAPPSRLAALQQRLTAHVTATATATEPASPHCGPHARPGTMRSTPPPSPAAC